MIKYIIVDDEPIAHDIIKGYGDALPNLTFVKHCYDAIEAMVCLRTHKIDLIFLDLNMPKLKGFDFLKSIQNPPKVIVTTAYSEFALDGYELNVVDYLLKPFSFERFVQAINKVNISKANSGVTPTLLTHSEDSIFVKSSKKLVQIKLNAILFVESVGNYCKIMTTDEEVQVREKISDFITKLPQQEFYQVHKSFIVSKSHINIIEGNRIFIKDFTIPVGKVYKNNLNKLF